MSTSRNTDRPLVEQITDALVEYLIANELQQGDRLPSEPALCTLLAVGRSTLREAIRMLCSRGVLEVRHGAGTFVSGRLGVADDPLGFAFVRDKAKLVADLLDFRMMIEPRLAAAAAGTATPAERQALRAQCDDVEALIRAGADYTHADADLHTMIGTLSRNCLMPRLMPIIVGSIDLFVKGTGDALRTETIRTHRAVVDAICAGDALAASDAMLLHLTYNRDCLRKLQQISTASFT